MLQILCTDKNDRKQMTWQCYLKISLIVLKVKIALEHYEKVPHIHCCKEHLSILCTMCYINANPYHKQ